MTSVSPYKIFIFVLVLFLLCICINPGNKCCGRKTNSFHCDKSSQPPAMLKLWPVISEPVRSSAHLERKWCLISNYSISCPCHRKIVSLTLHPMEVTSKHEVSGVLPCCSMTCQWAAATPLNICSQMACWRKTNAGATLSYDVTRLWSSEQFQGNWIFQKKKNCRA